MIERFDGSACTADGGVCYPVIRGEVFVVWCEGRPGSHEFQEGVFGTPYGALVR